MTEYARRSARVLVVNDDERVLLFDYYYDAGDHEKGHGWFTPGGGVDAGEGVRDAAARELLEETGLRVRPEQLGSVVAYASGHAELGWANGLFRDDYFFVRVPEHEVDLGGMLDYETSNLVGWQWWSVDELQATSDGVIPLNLVPLLQRLMAGDIPTHPVELPWHH